MANRYPLQQSEMQSRVDLSVRSNVPTAYPRQRPVIWPQHAPQQLEEQNEKQREYLKQQQKLRLMTATSAPQSVSADALIENLLGKKETFKLKVTHQTVPHANQTIAQPLMVPGIMSPQMATPVRPTVGYSLPSTITSGPSCSMGMVGSFSSSEIKSQITPVATVTSQMDVNTVPQIQYAVNLPAWLNPTSPLFPQFYQQVWKIVEQEKGLVDTARIFPLLLTSELPTDVLGYIWGLANRKVAGQLTEQELYIVLALVALAQNGCTFNNLDILNLIPQPPIPNLKIIGLESKGTIPVKDTENIVFSDQSKMKREDLNLNQFSLAVTNSTIPVSVSDDAGFDEFTEFQSATTVVPTVNSKDNISFPKPDVQTSVISSSSSPTTSPIDVITERSAAKCPSVLVVSSGHGRGIGSRLANHSLGTPKQKKSKHHHHRHHHHHSQSQITNIPVSVDEEFSEFQQAKEPVKSPADGNIDYAFPKCALKPVPQGKTYLLKESAIRSEIKSSACGSTLQIAEVIKKPVIPVSLGSCNSDFEDKTEKDKTECLSEKSHLDEQNIVPGIEQKLSMLPSNELKTEGVNLMAIEEDKYSALRNLSLANQDLVLDKLQAFSVVELSPATDEFGDFLSAEPVQVINDSFADIATRERGQNSNILDMKNTASWKSESPQVVEFEVDDWGDFKDALSDSASVSNQIPPVDIDKDSVVSEHMMKEGSEISSAFMNLDLDDKISWNQTDKLQIFPNSSESSGDLNLSKSWDLKFKDDSSENNAGLNGGETSTFQGFLGKIYDSKPDLDSVKVNIFYTNTEKQLRDRSNSINIDIQTEDIGNEDDFGEFVGSDAWAEESKYNATVKDVLFDGQLGSGLRDAFYGDTQSVSSLELPPLALSRHGSVPSLDLKIFPTTAERNGGNGGNQPWDMSPQSIDHQLNEWQRCLQSCLTLLQSAVETFNNISSEKVLGEVIGFAEGKDYLQNILEVAGVSHRIECSYRQLVSNGEYRKLDTLLIDINTAWSSLEQYYTKADISMSLEDSSSEEIACETSVSCGICLIDVNITKTNNRNTSQLEYGGHVYHSVCANLWVNCVESNLPALAIGNSTFL